MQGVNCKKRQRINEAEVVFQNNCYTGKFEEITLFTTRKKNKAGPIVRKKNLRKKKERKEEGEKTIFRI